MFTATKKLFREVLAFASWNSASSLTEPTSYDKVNDVLAESERSGVEQVEGIGEAFLRKPRKLSC